MSFEEKSRAIADLQELASTLSKEKDKNRRLLQRYHLDDRDRQLGQLTIKMLQHRYSQEDTLLIVLVEKRFILETLQIRYAGKTTYQVLEILHETLRNFFKDTSLSDEEWREFYDLARQQSSSEILSNIPIEQLLTEQETEIVQKISALGNLSDNKMDELRSLILTSDISNLYNIGIFLVEHFPSKWQEGMCLFFTKFE